MAFKAILSLGLVGIASAIPTVRSAEPAVSSTTCKGQTYVYEGFAGYGFTPSNSRDKFGDTAGGIGSSATIDRNSWKRDGDSYTGIVWNLPDRGWNTQGTLNYQPRIHKFQMKFTPNASATLQHPSPPNVQLTYLDSILLTDPSGTPITGLDADAKGPYLSFPGFPELPSATYTGDGFGNAGPGGHRVVLDSEGIVLNKDGSFWVSDEYGPYIYRFSPTGKMLSAIRPVDAVIPRRNNTDSFSANSPPEYNPNFKVIPGTNPTGRTNNQGLEGLTASPDGKKLYALMQSALSQEGGSNATNARRNSRFFIYDVSNPSKPTLDAEYIVPLPLFSNDSTVAAQSEIHYISPTQFLVLARDSGRGHGQKNSTSIYRHADVFDISTATNIHALSNADCFTCHVASVTGVLNSTITPATYCSFLDYNINSQLGLFGLHNGGAQDALLLNEKWESLALVPVLADKQSCGSQGWGNWNEYFLFSWTDNDFITQNGFLKNGTIPYKDDSGFNLDNQVLVFKVQLPKGAQPLIG